MSINSGIDHIEIFKEIFHHSSESTLLLDQDGVIVLANQSAFELFDSNTLKGKKVTNFFKEKFISGKSTAHLIKGFPYNARTENLSFNNLRAVFFKPLFQSPDPNKWFSDIGDLFKEPMWVINSEFQLVNYNLAFKEQVEAFRNKPIEKGDYILYPEYDQSYLAFWKEAYEKAMQGIEKQYHFERADFTPGKFYSLTVTPVKKDDNIIGVACYTQDITEDVAQKIRLEKHANKLKKSFELASMSEWEYNLTTKSFWWLANTPDLIKIPSSNLPINWDDFLQLIHSDFKKQVCYEFESIGSSNYFKIDVKMTFDNKSYYWVRLTGTGLEEDSKSGIKLIGIIQNINSQKLADLQLIESENRYKELINATPGIIFQHNLTTNTGLYYSGKTQEILGYSVEEMTRVKDFWINKIHPEDQEKLTQAEVFNAKSQPVISEYRIRHKFGHWIWLKEYCIDLKKIKDQYVYTGITFDITSEKENKIRLNLALESANLGVYEHDLVTDEFMMDDKILQIIGYQREELPRTYQELVNMTIHPDEKPRSHKIPQEAASIGMEGIYVISNRIIHKTGKIVYHY